MSSAGNKKGDIRVIGISGCTIRPEKLQMICSCPHAAAADRLWQALEKAAESCNIQTLPKQIPITPVNEMISRVREARATGPVAILASGDPLFYGIGTRLLKEFPPYRLHFHPALSAVQMACAKFKRSWEQARIISIHGRDMDLLPFRLLTTPMTFLFTDGKNTPAAVARALLHHLHAADAHKAIQGIRLHVAENMECPGERSGCYTLEQAASMDFSPLNITLVEVPAELIASRGTGLTESDISHINGMITKDEIRAVTLHRLKLAPGQVLWDVGAGSGAIAIEAARLWHDLAAFAIEMRQERLEVIKENLRRLGILNLLPIHGTAPDALSGLPKPDRVFIGGSGGNLREIIKHCAMKMDRGSIMVANAILKQTASEAPAILEAEGFHLNITRVHAERPTDSIGQGDWQALNTITVIQGIKKG